jgi:arginine/lysine/ornithine decarboxylase
VGAGHTPYPPGIPAIVQGNRINTAIIDYLCSGFEAGMVIPDSAYPTLATKLFCTSLKSSKQRTSR